MKKQQLLGLFVNNVDMKETVAYIGHLIEIRKKSYVIPVNVDVLLKNENDEYLRKITNEAELTLIDGQPLVWIAKWLGNPVKAKISGSDLVPEVCRMAAEKGYSIFIVGGAEGIALKAKQNLERDMEGINVCGVYSPPFGFEKDPIELERINSMISDLSPDIVIACLGCPKQEKWVYENYLKYGGTVSICAGATVDFLAGSVKRAPRWMSDHGLEWLYRFFREPRRLFKRYFIDDMKIFRVYRKYRKELKK